MDEEEGMVKAMVEIVAKLLQRMFMVKKKTNQRIDKKQLATISKEKDIRRMSIEI